MERLKHSAVKVRGGDMKTIVSIVTILAVSSIARAQTDTRNLAAVVLEGAGRSSAGGMTTETEALAPDQYAIADMTVSGGPVSFATFAHDQFSTGLAEELVAAYGAASKSPNRLDASYVGTTPVLDLFAFETGANSYDWARLNAKYPNVRAVIRVSRPAVVSDAFALARYEVIVPAGRGWAWIQKFEKRGDQSWVRTTAVIGDVW
jgi:hypothetical protein